jgi:hypothetical protein
MLGTWAGLERSEDPPLHSPGALQRIVNFDR